MLLHGGIALRKVFVGPPNHRVRRMITIYEEFTKSMEMPCPVKTVRNRKKGLEKSLESQQKRVGPRTALS